MALDPALSVDPAIIAEGQPGHPLGHRDERALLNQVRTALGEDIDTLAEGTVHDAILNRATSAELAAAALDASGVVAENYLTKVEGTATYITQAARGVNVMYRDDPDTEALGDASGALLSSRFGSLAAAQDALGSTAATDLTQTIDQAVLHNAMLTGAAFVPPSDLIVAHPTPFIGSILTEGDPNLNTITAAAGFDGAMMLDFNAGTERKRIDPMTWDANLVAAMQIWGSTSSGGAGGSSNSVFDQPMFRNSADGVYAIGGSSSVAEGGMFTGAVLIRPQWLGCQLWLNLGNNQDDCTLIAPRFKMPAGRPPVSYPLTVDGSNPKFLTTFISTAESTIARLINVNRKPTTFDGLFIEDVADGITEIFNVTGVTKHLVVRDVELNLVTSLGADHQLTALVFTAVKSTDNNDGLIAVENVRNKRGARGSLTGAIFNVQSNNPAQILTLRFAGADCFASPARFDNNVGTDLTEGSILLDGTHGDKRWNHKTSATRAGTATNVTGSVVRPQEVDGREGTPASHAFELTASQASPHTKAFTLPSAGLWMVNVSARLNASKDHMISGVWYVWFNNATLDLLDSQLVGTTAQTPSTYSITGLTLSDPTDAGVVTATASWGDASSRSCRWDISARKLSSFDGPWVP